MRRKRRGSGENHTDHSKDWLTTYSDLMTLLFTFFVLLYSFSVLDQQKFDQMIKSFQGSLGVLDGGPSINQGYPPNEATLDSEENDSNLTGETGEENPLEEEIRDKEEYLRYQMETEKLEGLKEELAEYLADQGIAANVALSVEERGLVIRLQDSVLFESSKADILPASRQILSEVGRVLLNTENNVRIEGHTDNLPINTPRFPSNWELSTSRATNVLRFLIEEGISPDRLSAVGYGEYHPIASNDIAEGRQKNRRVDIVILRDSLRKFEP
ncbi:MAG: flagellar motor protein MotB [Peptococcia bacterium]